MRKWLERNWEWLAEKIIGWICLALFVAGVLYMLTDPDFHATCYDPTYGWQCDDLPYGY